jgi:hypothetical protein
LTFIRGGAFNGGGGGFASNGIIPLVLDADDEDENEKDRLDC